VFVLLAGDVIVTTGGVPRMIVTVFVSEPDALVQTTVNRFEPIAKETVLFPGDAAAPFNVQEIGAVPVAEKLITAVAVLTSTLLEGELIVTTGASVRVTVTDALVDAPNAPVQATVIVFGPVASATLLVDVLVEAAPLTVQVVPDGMTPPPFSVY